MTWKNALQLSEQYSAPDWRASFGEAYAARLFISRGIISPAFSASDDLVESVKLTSQAESLLSEVPTCRSLDEPNKHLVAFMCFAHHELLVDLDSSNYDTLWRFIADCLADQRLMHPWTFGRTLYDRFFELFDTNTDHLAWDETNTLLNNTPQGVCQLGTYLTGPLGILTSLESRYAPPQWAPPLWHCSDPGCSAIHTVVLEDAETQLVHAYRDLREHLNRKQGHSSEWTSFFSDVMGLNDSYYSHLNRRALAPTLANIFTPAEIKLITTRLISDHSKLIRDKLPSTNPQQVTFDKPATDIATSLDTASCTQIIWLAPDPIIERVVDGLVTDCRIQIPATEVRRSMLMHPSAGWYHIAWECSSLGVRSDSLREDIGVKRLRWLILSLYSGSDLQNQLAWDLRFQPGTDVEDKLDLLLASTEPHTIIRNLLFRSELHLRQTLAILNLHEERVPSTSIEEDGAIETILWKLGFEVWAAPRHFRNFQERLVRCSHVVNEMTDGGPHNDELLRGAAANLFVALEDVLERSLAFSCWFLLLDHYEVTHFTFRLGDARECMAEYLNASPAQPTDRIAYDACGKNTLYPLIAGFSLLANTCWGLLANSHIETRRPRKSLPGWHDETELDTFPLLSNQLIFDLREADKDRLLNSLADVTRQLTTAKVCEMRNRIEHKRDRFPLREEIQACLAGVQRGFDILMDIGLAPILYLPAGIEVDNYRRQRFRLTNEFGRTIEILDSPRNRIDGMPSPTRPVLAVPSAHVGSSSDIFRFRLVEESSYDEMWNDYPRRKYRNHPPSADDPEAASE